MAEIGNSIPVGGNAYITQKDDESTVEITEDGLINWIDTTTTCSIFVHLSQPGTFGAGFVLQVPSAGTSQLRLSIANTAQSYVFTATGEEPHLIKLGTIFTAPSSGYIQLNLQGITRTGPVFAEVFSLVIDDYTAGRIQYIKPGFSYYFGRRGPSVHLRPTLPSGRNLQYFYNEIVVPPGQDVVGSYYMATGFAGGYFGIQVVSPTERWVLFSIWSAFDSDDPGQVPEDYKVQLIKKGDEVLVQEFGNEGTGLQSILQYNWIAGETYKFLVFGTPVPNTEDETVFTGWFWTPSTGQWQLMASFMRPKTSTYLTNLYSFLENFIPDQGQTERMVNFDNQWVRDTNGIWLELTHARFTGDDTSRNGRLDYAGGIDVATRKFYLKNCGFFNNRVTTNTEFIRTPTNRPPEVDLEDLP